MKQEIKADNDDYEFIDNLLDEISNKDSNKLYFL